MPLHYISPISTDWTRGWSRGVLISGCFAPAHMPLIQEQMCSTDLALAVLPTISRPVPRVLRAASSIQPVTLGHVTQTANVIHSDAHLQRFLLVMNCRSVQEREKLATNI